MKFGEYLVENGLIDMEQLDAALEEQQRRRGHLPRLLIEQGLMSDESIVLAMERAKCADLSLLEVAEQRGDITAEQRVEIEQRHRESGPRLGELMVEMGMIDNETRIRSLAILAGVIKPPDDHSSMP